MSQKPKHRLYKRDLLDYALEGARTRRGLLCNFPEDADEADDIERDIAEIERRIKLIDTYEAKQ